MCSSARIPNRFDQLPAYSAQRGGEAETLQHRWPQLPHAERDVLVELPRQVLQRFNLRVGGRAFGRQRLERFQRQTQRRHLLSELIVQLARDAPPFVFLRQDQPGEQLRALLLDALPLLDFVAKRTRSPPRVRRFVH